MEWLKIQTEMIRSPRLARAGSVPLLRRGGKLGEVVIRKCRRGDPGAEARSAVGAVPVDTRTTGRTGKLEPTLRAPETKTPGSRKARSLQCRTGEKGLRGNRRRPAWKPRLSWLLLEQLFLALDLFSVRFEFPSQGVGWPHLVSVIPLDAHLWPRDQGAGSLRELLGAPLPHTGSLQMRGLTWWPGRWSLFSALICKQRRPRSTS
uniref:Uncharacterized protein n=1 Tax=Rousettus aegyptiacus TaxID=9407 RepID=A0A7J8C2N5_ROUAE|nr:hypothetical protein HJG63_009434 [Rousettus aegyptiacus]